VLEAVPNVSEGRDASVIEAIGSAFARSARLLDVHSDADHNRSVYTLVGAGDELVDALLAGVERAQALIDLERHEGVHPRVGAADVVPVVYLRREDAAAATSAALMVAERVGDELNLPVFLYGEIGTGRRPADFRRGGPDEIARRLESGELRPEFGPPRLSPTAGAVLVGARKPLVAYNLDLATEDVSVARAVAAVVRESGGGMPGVQAIGLYLPRSRRVQVSMNILDVDRSPVHEVVGAVTREAALRGADVIAGELVGLVPQRVLDEAEASGAALPGIDASHVLERRLAL
jgi:glutamate formiminotransferase